ncbi:hypothetical protein SAMN04487891_104237 [Flagellimonas taeanensis]|jgi:hypothetical protein|uniref:DoxX-like family protein n=2 Tax=Flagellimonas taeanensis TaxID=1005926 RepID=A0A1M6WY56_9FLAO|nr:hypothetical protein [Allomuricauda taeanensis]SFB99389.1 hypothetical protein SAMN04487891_104237 [Allomuricauda taeanensis]SHK98680.1 hypothetical protein SAMN05216293_2362 [Allomuricauda taeanensis]
MMSRIISGIVLLVTVYIGISHGSRVFQRPSEQYLEMMDALGITDPMRIAFGVLSIASVLLILLPRTFFIGNTIRALLLVFLMALSLKAGNYTFALIEIPFVMMPLVLIYLGHPLKFN